MSDGRSIRFTDVGPVHRTPMTAFWSTNAQDIIISWIYVPIGITIILLACFGIDRLIRLSSVSFPASVACMILLFCILLLCELALGARIARRVVAILDVPCGFALRWISIYFCPPFVLLPISPVVGGREVGKIITLLIIGYLVMFTFTAYLVRLLQLIFGTPKRAMLERAEEVGPDVGEVSLTELNGHEEAIRSTVESEHSLTHEQPLSEDIHQTQFDTPSIPTEVSAVSPSRIEGEPCQVFIYITQTISAVQGHATIFAYSLLFFTVGLPIYFSTGYSMPAHLMLTVLTFHTAISIPPRWRQFLHPSMVSAGIVIAGIWVLSKCRGDTFQDSLRSYQTKTRYLQVFRGERGLPLPGAGDILSSILDASIVAFALPMFRYRAELKRSFFPIILPNIAISIASLFGYPPLCHALGIEPSRSLSFASRSLTLALAQISTQNLGGDQSVVAILCIFSGIFGVVIGPAMLKVLKIPEDDYITRGVTLGGNSSAIATALLLQTDPRAAAISTLSMSLFGTITVVFTSIPMLARIVVKLAGG